MDSIRDRLVEELARIRGSGLSPDEKVDAIEEATATYVAERELLGKAVVRNAWASVGLFVLAAGLVFAAAGIPLLFRSSPGMGRGISNIVFACSLTAGVFCLYTGWRAAKFFTDAS